MEEKKKRLAKSGLRGVARFCALQKLYETEFESDLLKVRDIFQNSEKDKSAESNNNKVSQTFARDAEKSGGIIGTKDGRNAKSKVPSDELDMAFLSDSISVSEMDREFLKNLLNNCYENLETIDQFIRSSLAETWSLERLDPVTKCILRLGITEIIYFPETPENVIFNEYVEIAKAFFEKSEVAFINGLLNKVGQKVRKEKETTKQAKRKV